MKDQRKLVISIFCVLSVLLITIGVTYSVFTYTKQGDTQNTVTTGKLTFLYTENTGTGTGINITNAFPVSDTLGKTYTADNQVFDFKVESEIVGNATIPYEVTVAKTSSSTIPENLIKLYLTDTTDAEEVELLAPTKYSKLPIAATNENEKQIYFDTVDANEDYLKKFRLRMWIADGTDQEEINEKTFTVKVNVYSDQDVVLGEAPVVCKRATTLHTEICSQTNATAYCRADGYALGSEITYGNLGTQGTLTSGDAFDCDVNGDGTFDAAKERFYYVSDLDTDTAVMIYYNNVSAGQPDNKAVFAYNSDSYNYNGPVIGIQQLPTTTQWKNVSLKDKVRNIKDPQGEARVENFDYSGYAARLLTMQELEQACDISVFDFEKGVLANCKYFLENTKYSDDNLSSSEVWLENVTLPTTCTTCSSGYVYQTWTLNSFSRYPVNLPPVMQNGIRPVIEVPKEDIKF